jgi:hypothetical protein
MRVLVFRAHPGAGFVRPGSTDSHPIEMDDHCRSRPSLAQFFFLAQAHQAAWIAVARLRASGP